MTLLRSLGLLAIAFLFACQTVESDRQRSAEEFVHMEFHSMGVVEIAVLPPRVPDDLAGTIAATVREEAREYLIRQKRYSVVTSAVVDGESAPDPTEDPESARRRIETDAVLQITIDEIDRRDQASHGTIWLTGSLKLLGSGGRELWWSSFTNHREILRGPSDPTTRQDQLIAAFEGVVLDKLATLPVKRNVAGT